MGLEPNFYRAYNQIYTSNQIQEVSILTPIDLYLPKELDP